MASSWQAGDHVVMTREEYLELVNRKEELEQKIDAIQSKCEEEVGRAKKEAAFQAGLNTNLLRICRERANAERKLKPKKEHEGYVIISSAEKEKRVKIGIQVYNLAFWETVFQSPYRIDFLEEQARKLCARDFFGEMSKDTLREIGFKWQNTGGFEELARSMNDEIYSQNWTFNMRMRANFKAGYWECIYEHTLPIDTIPRDMLP